jgi:superfamily II DNA or RNA helicase
VGSIVRCRNREWVILPSSDENLLLLRPLTGSEKEICGIFRPLSNLGFDRVEPANFPLPKPEDTGDAIGAELLWNAARLSLRDGAGPFRSLGRVSVRPRAYQFVPLLMSLRLDPVRLFIADDVGVGKTIEALLIAREFLDRGEIQRLAVLCPPYLCDQWQRELQEKFHIDAVVIRSGTVGQLERGMPSGDYSVFGYYPHIVVSIDYAKTDRHRANFLLHCPEFLIVDEAHGAAQPSAHSRGQQQRHELLKDLARNTSRHLVLLTATPHSGVEDSFRSLLALIQGDFGNFQLQSLAEKERESLARHFVQRRRADVQNWIGEETPFPDRDPKEETYDLTASYRTLFEKVYDFSRELVRTGETLTGWKKRIRFWTALALLRCVMSSPAAAVTALQTKEKGLLLGEEGMDDTYSPYIYEHTDEETVDVQPAHIVQEGESDLNEGERRRLRDFTRLAESLKGERDPKLLRCIDIVRGLLREGYQPIVWCRYIATSDYVAEEIKNRMGKEFPDLRLISITGSLAEEERRERVKEFENFQRRVLVATDCLSEGINLQDLFSAVIHYDLPWNPNRLEQREGRVDRFGQRAKKVKTVLFYGRNNPVDGAVLDVLLRKAKEIHRSLGITVPVPVDSETVMEAVLKALFSRGDRLDQLSLFEDPSVSQLHRRWDQTVCREKENRTRFAQRAVKPEEVKRELEETDSVLGDPEAVSRFVLNACQRFKVTIKPRRDGNYALGSLDRLPEMIRNTIPATSDWAITFNTPAPEKTTFVGRNHPFVSSLAQYLMEEALTKGGEARAPRCGVIRTKRVTRRTTLLLLRLRFSLQEPDKKPLLAEESLVKGFRGTTSDSFDWLPDGEAMDLLSDTTADANITPGERSEVLEEVLGWWKDLASPLKALMNERGDKLQDSHRRIRSAARLIRRGLSVSPHLPPELLGILVFLPVPQGVA